MYSHKRKHNSLYEYVLHDIGYSPWVFTLGITGSGMILIYHLDIMTESSKFTKFNCKSWLVVRRCYHFNQFLRIGNKMVVIMLMTSKHFKVHTKFLSSVCSGEFSFQHPWKPRWIISVGKFCEITQILITMKNKILTIAKWTQ